MRKVLLVRLWASVVGVRRRMLGCPSELRLGRSSGLELRLWGFFITALPREATAFAAGMGPDPLLGRFPPVAKRTLLSLCRHRI